MCVLLQVGWALGAMLYEMNELPWEYEITEGKSKFMEEKRFSANHLLLSIAVTFVFCLSGIGLFKFVTTKRKRRLYEPINSELHYQNEIS